MTTGNGGAAIGLANTSKLVAIGSQVADTTDPGSGTSSYVGNDVTEVWWSSNVLSEDVAGPFLVPSANDGKDLQWVTTGGSPVTVGAEGRVTATNGVIVDDVAGTLKTYITPGVVIPAGAYLWVESFTASSAITFNDADPIVAQTPQQGVPFSLDISTHFLNGFPPKLYEIFSGTLPPGLTLASGTGVVSGSATTIAAATPIVFKGSDGRGNSANSNSVNFTVIAAAGTWNPADKASGIVLSGSNNNAGRFDAVQAFSSVRGTSGKNSGKRYFEVTNSAGSGITSTADYAGVADSTMSLTTQPIFGAGGGHYAAMRGQAQYGNQGGFVGGGSFSPWNGTPPETMGIAVDFATRTVSFYTAAGLSGSTTYSAGGGDMFPFCSLDAGAGIVGTLNLKTVAPFTLSVPATYSAWD